MDSTPPRDLRETEPWLIPSYLHLITVTVYPPVGVPTSQNWSLEDRALLPGANFGVELSLASASFRPLLSTELEN
jgi:hypothetical protein